MILISHNMNDVLAVADDIAVLYLGQMTAQVEAKDVTHSEVVQLITGGAMVEKDGHVVVTDPHDPVLTSRRHRPRRDGRPVMTQTALERGSRPRERSPHRSRPAWATPSASTSSRVRGGDVGPLPAILGLAVLVVVFSALRPETFTNSFNFANLLIQSAPVIVIAMGLVFVLLIGEIDLSAGFTAGVAGAVLGVVSTRNDHPWYLGVLACLAAGAAIGLVIGLLVAGSASRPSSSPWPASSPCRACC